jgi:hypothetical protein
VQNEDYARDKEDIAGYLGSEAWGVGAFITFGYLGDNMKRKKGSVKYNVEVTLFRKSNTYAEKIIRIFGTPSFIGRVEMYDNYGRYNDVIRYDGVDVYTAREMSKIIGDMIGVDGVVFIRRS